MKKSEFTLVCVCGATATGKSDLAFDLAQKLKTEIINFDSVQVYRELDIGTAKPPQEMRDKIRHHLIDEVSPHEIFTAGDFRRRALKIIDSLKTENTHGVLVGGTGFYLQALLKGMYAGAPSDPQLRRRLEEKLAAEGLEKLYGDLKRLDPEYGAKIHGNDQYRILRALEVMELNGKTVTEIRREFEAQSLPFQVHLLGLRRKKEILRQAVLDRARRMIQDGLVEETRALMKKYGEKIRPLESVGYKETVSFIKGEIISEELPLKIASSTMALAKRQTTWFKRNPQIHWMDPDEITRADLISRALNFLKTS